jgi:phenylalanyl-tRNA synthetase beta chain
METGQPLHAFDFDRLAQHRIVVKTAEKGQTFKTLDGMERSLGPDMLMICDGEGPVALAGIMGGLESEIEDHTKHVLIESAYFNPITTRRTAKRLGLSTESSYRFERGVDPFGVRTALDRSAQLMVELAGGKLAKGVVDVFPGRFPKKAIQISVKRTNRLLGTRLSRGKIETYLKSIEADVKRVDRDRIEVTAPSFRVDIARPEDLMEEVARLWGYNHIPITHPVSEAVARKPKKNLQVRTRLRALLASCGFSEILTYSFIGQDACERLMIGSEDRRRQMVSVLNPLSEDQEVMRTSLLPGLLSTLYRNSTQRNENLRVFELGKVFIKTGPDQLPDEIEMASGMWTGERYEKSWHFKETKVDFYDMKGVVEVVCAGLNISGVRFSPLTGASAPYMKRGHAALVRADDEILGTVGELSRRVLSNFGLKNPVYCFDLNFDLLTGRVSEEKQAKPLSRFPATFRDIALILDDKLGSQDVLDFIAGLGQELIEEVDVFDIYRGSPVPAGKKSVALRFTYRSFERNLTDEEVNTIHEGVTRKLLKQFKAQLPAG